MRLTLFTLLLIALISACSSDKKVETHLHIECSAETISGKKFKEGDHYLSNANCRSSAYSRTGEFGFKLDVKHEFGASFKLDDIKKGDIIYASVYRKKGGESGQLIIASKGQLQYESNDVSLQENVEWELINVSFVAKQDMILCRFISGIPKRKIYTLMISLLIVFGRTKNQNMSRKKISCELKYFLRHWIVLLNLEIAP